MTWIPFHSFRSLDLCAHLRENGVDDVAFISGTLKPEERNKVLKDVKNHKYRVIISTDLVVVYCIENFFIKNFFWKIGLNICFSCPVASISSTWTQWSAWSAHTNWMSICTELAVQGALGRRGWRSPFWMGLATFASSRLEKNRSKNQSCQKHLKPC